LAALIRFIHVLHGDGGPDATGTGVYSLIIVIYFQNILKGAVFKHGESELLLDRKVILILT